MFKMVIGILMLSEIVSGNSAEVIFDRTLPALKSVTVTEAGGVSTIKYVSAVDVSTTYLPGGSGLKSVWLWIKKSTDDVWRPVSKLTGANGSFKYTRTDPIAVRYFFAVQSEDRAGNKSPLVIPVALKPQAWFFLPDSFGKMRVALKLPPGKKLSNYLAAGFTLATGETITKIGVGGPNGWGLASKDIVAYKTLPVTNLYTGFDSDGRFRGTPFVITSTGRVGYFNLGPVIAPIWEMSFGNNFDLVFPDGGDGTIIDFYESEYVLLPNPTVAFNWKWDADRQQYDVTAVLNVVGRDMRDVFYNLGDQLEIKTLTVEHYYVSGIAPWTLREKGFAFKDLWPAEVIIDKVRPPIVRVTLVCVDRANLIHYADVSKWLAYVNGKLVMPKNGAWEFSLSH